MLSCPTSFEIYKTDDIAQNWYEQPQHGELYAGIISPTVSRELEKSGRLTYLQNDRDVMTAYVDASNEIVKEKIMILSGIPDSVVFKTVWVFDTVVITLTTTDYMVIYEKPIVKGIISKPLPLDLTDNQVTGSMYAYEIGVNKTLENRFE